MRSDGSLNTDLIPDYYEFLDRNGVAGVFINGTTGEGPSLTQKEKKLQIDAWTTVGKRIKSMEVINLVGGTSYPECIDNAIYSKEAGVSAVAVIAPYFFRPADAAGLAEFIIRIGESVPGLPVYFYHIPSITGVYIPMAGLLKEIEGKLPNFSGVKYTNEDFMDFLACLKFGNGKYDMLWGRDECMLSALATGTKGFVGSTYNYAAPLYHGIIEAFERNDLQEAQRLQMISVNMISLLGKYGGIATGKAFMKYIGFDCGAFRLPVKNMTDRMYDDFAKDVRSLGMDDLFSKR
jgi:N-acetylneuraminate lyase